MFASFAVCRRGVVVVASLIPCRGDWRRGVLRRAWWTCVSRGRRGTPDACPRSGRHWRVDPRGRCGETCIWTFAHAFHVAGVGQGGHRRCRKRGFAWPAWGSVRAACVSRGRRGEWCDRWPRWAGAGNRARQLKSLDFVALCEKSAVRARVPAFGVAKSRQAQGIRRLVDVRLERTFCGTQRQAAPGVSRVRRCAMGIAVGRVAWVALCHGLLVGGVTRRWRRAMRIAGAWMALCHWDSLLGRTSCGRRRVIGIADQGVVWVAPCFWDW